MSRASSAWSRRAVVIGLAKVEGSQAQGNGRVDGTPAAGSRLAGWLLLLCAVLPFAGTRAYPEVHDDLALRGPGSLVRAPDVDLATLLRADFFGTPDHPDEQSGYWRPLVLLSFALEARLAGGSSAGFDWLGHVVTILCHAAATLALWRLLRACDLPPAAALCAAALFAVHPVHAETVAWISGRVDSLAAALGFGGLAAWLSGRHGRLGTPLAVGLLALAPLAKETAVLFLVLGVLLARWRGRSWSRALGPPVTALALVLLARGLLFGLLAGPAPEADLGPDTALTRWLTWLSVCPDLVGLTIWPGVATPLRPVVAAARWSDPGVLAGLATLLAVLVAGLEAWRRRWGPGILAFALVGGTLLLLAPWKPLPRGFSEVAGPLADRYVYAAAAAPGILLAAVLARPLARLGRGALGVPVILLAALGPATAGRCAMWSSDEAFARAALRVAPGSANLWSQLGAAQLAHLQEDGDVQAGEAALESFDRALALDSDHRLAHLDRFITLALLDRQDDAEAEARRLLQRWPDDPLVLHNLAEWHAGEERYAEAALLYAREIAGGSPLPGAAEALAACRRALERAGAGGER